VQEAAVSNCNGRAKFVRVVGNTTSSHLAGAKTGAYGKLQTFPVRLVSASRAVQAADFLKIDAEGHECEILESIPLKSWKKLCCVLEIGSPENARRVFEWSGRNHLGIRAQKIRWVPCRKLADLPSSYREGSVLLASRSAFRKVVL
jgi:hypothetical protein